MKQLYDDCIVNSSHKKPLFLKDPGVALFSALEEDKGLNDIDPDVIIPIVTKFLFDVPRENSCEE
jgi:hypothetical protein